MILWFGWYGFNPGSSTAILPAGFSLPTQLAAVNTTLAPCASGLTGLFIKAIITKIKHGAYQAVLASERNPTLHSCPCAPAGIPAACNHSQHAMCGEACAEPHSDLHLEPDSQATATTT